MYLNKKITYDDIKKISNNRLEKYKQDMAAWDRKKSEYIREKSGFVDLYSGITDNVEGEFKQNNPPPVKPVTDIDELINIATRVLPIQNIDIIKPTKQSFWKRWMGFGGKSKRKRSLFRFKKTQTNKPKKRKATRKKHNKRKKVHLRTIKKVK